MKTKSAAPSIRESFRSAIEADLKKTIAEVEADLGNELTAMIRYHLGWSGGGAKAAKRIRPLLTLLCCDAAGGEWEIAVPGASALEFIHNFTLIHDDIQDRSETRRGRPTLWSRWGVPKAINAGDSLYAIAHLSAHRLYTHGSSPATVLEVTRLLDRACLELTAGQQLDLAFEGASAVSETDYLRMIEGKTAALLAASAATGALLAGLTEDQVHAYDRFGRNLGLAFQIQDDILGIWGSPDETGKSTGDDIRARKNSLPVVYGLAHSAEFAEKWYARNGPHKIEALVLALEASGAREYARELSEKHTNVALEALDSASPQGQGAVELRALSRHLLKRQS